MTPLNRDDDYALIRAGQTPSNMKPPLGNLTDNAWRIVLAAYAKMTTAEFIRFITFPEKQDDFIIAMGIQLEKTNQCYDHSGRENWVKAMIRQIRDYDKKHIYPLPDNGHGGPRLEPEPQHTHSMNYSTTPVARPTLVYGEDVADMNEARTMQVIKALNAEVKDLSETGVTSRLIEQRIAERGAAINELVKHLDSFASPASAPASAE